ncbi:MAG TPA: hypothetical protein VG944_20340 [Fimbriimonas sp.]|nr:hypothetical protein [Fimbriimonas sp.]
MKSNNGAVHDAIPTKDVLASAKSLKLVQNEGEEQPRGLSMAATKGDIAKSTGVIVAIITIATFFISTVASGTHFVDTDGEYKRNNDKTIAAIQGHMSEQDSRIGKVESKVDGTLKLVGSMKAELDNTSRSTDRIVSVLEPLARWARKHP